MILGIPKEIKKEEYRVAMTPEGTRELTTSGHTVLIEKGAGRGSGFADDDYLKNGAVIVQKEELFKQAELIVKVKEPIREEFVFFQDQQALFTFLHLAPNFELTEFLLKKRITALGYETLERNGNLFLLSPMSEIAGRMAPLVGSYYLQKFCQGSGVFPPGAIGVKPAKIIILGAGVVGINAVRIACALGMDTTVLNRGYERLEKIDELYKGKVKTLPLIVRNIEEEIKAADLVIGAILIPGGKTPELIKQEMLGKMKKGSVIVDVSVDQGGCCETTKPTTHEDPVYVIHDVVHYAVANMPGAYPRTSTLALTNVSLPYIKTVADMGIERALKENDEIRSALNIYEGRIVHKRLAKDLKGKFCGGKNKS